MFSRKKKQTPGYWFVNVFSLNTSAIVENEYPLDSVHSSIRAKFVKHKLYDLSKYFSYLLLLP